MTLTPPGRLLLTYAYKVSDKVVCVQRVSGNGRGGS
jgi:hypothetical protein